MSGTPRFGFTLSSEEHGPTALADLAVRAGDLDFDFVSISDHFHPWVAAQGHSPFVWSVLGAVAGRTRAIHAGVGVTCPLVRLHPAITAHAAATTARLFGGRFFLGVGTGEALNEHVLGHRWPPADTRLCMLEEAVAIMRRLWSGEVVDHHGRFYDVENAWLFDSPEVSLPVMVSAFGPSGADLAARIGDGYWGHTPDRELPDRYGAAGGTGPRLAQLTLCLADDAATAARPSGEGGRTPASRGRRARTCRRGPISSRSPRCSPRTRSWDRCPADRISSPSWRPCRPTSTRASTISTSIRWARIRRRSCNGGSMSSAPPSARSRPPDAGARDLDGRGGAGQGSDERSSASSMTAGSSSSRTCTAASSPL